jgi:hypothetical protein
LRADGMIIGITTSGPHQGDTIRKALPLTVDGQPLITTTQVTWADSTGRRNTSITEVRDGTW